MVDAGDETGGVLEIVEYTDPYCTWCWGSEPILCKIQEVYGSQVRISFKAGGLVKDVGEFYDPANNIGGPGMMEQVATHWDEASRRHGMPVDTQVWRELEGFHSTYPANVAFKAAQLVNPALGKKYLRRLREAAAAERISIHEVEVQIQLAEDVGLDPEAFRLALEDGSAEEAFQKDLKECREQGITGFPTFVIQNSRGASRVLNGYSSFELFERVFHELAGGTLLQQAIEASDENIVNFVYKYGKVATKEVEVVFHLSPRETREKLEQLLSAGKIATQRAGNGEFWLKLHENE